MTEGERIESAAQTWAAISDHAERYRDRGFGLTADKLHAGGPPPRSLRGTPVIIDTDIGGDPDDAIALICAAIAVPELALVITSDEHDGGRARFARYLLDLLDRRDIPVISGAQLNDTRYWVVADLVPDEIPTQSDDVGQAVNALCARTGGPVRWVGMGPLTNLANVLTNDPQLADQLFITQTGGAINYRDPSRASHNFRLDPKAAITVVNAATNLHLVISDVTTNDAIAIRSGDDIYRHLCTPNAPAWATVLRQHLDRWYTTFHPFTHQHDPLTLTAALRLPFVTFTRRHRFRIEDDARMFLDPNGHSTWTATNADYPAFLTWLNKQLAW
ncbi:nucleoside hydrolase [Nocardia sp. NPDC046473]|uniref:nucleoside hydrolase n=1 Tax=Nocardia sp. NPDC046473 TaxID=3155733 RepID=UPI0033D8BAB9